MESSSQRQVKLHKVVPRNKMNSRTSRVQQKNYHASDSDNENSLLNTSLSSLDNTSKKKVLHSSSSINKHRGISDESVYFVEGIKVEPDNLVECINMDLNEDDITFHISNEEFDHREHIITDTSEAITSNVQENSVEEQAECMLVIKTEDVEKRNHPSAFSSDESDQIFNELGVGSDGNYVITDNNEESLVQLYVDGPEEHDDQGPSRSFPSEKRNKKLHKPRKNNLKNKSLMQPKTYVQPIDSGSALETEINMKVPKKVRRQSSSDHADPLKDLLASVQKGDSSMIYAKVDKEDPRSRLHFVKYMKKDGKTIKIWECGICSREFVHQYTLMRHLPTHTDERNFICDECGKAFRQMSTLSQHRATHSKSRPYVCDICKKTFNRVSTLISHRRIHEGVKRHVCNVCGKAFHQKGNLKNHMFIHTNERPYKCFTCGRGFNQASNLHAHRIRAHSSNEQHTTTLYNDKSSSSCYVCSVCTITFNSKAALRKHESSAHSQMPHMSAHMLPLEDHSSNRHNSDREPLPLIDKSNDASGLNALRDDQSKRRRIGRVKILQLSTGEMSSYEMTQDFNGQGQIQTELELNRTVSEPNLLIPAISTSAFTNLMAKGYAPFALLMPAKSMPVIVKVKIISDSQHMLVPATAAELKQASKMNVSNSGVDSRAFNIKIPVVASVVERILDDGSRTIDILPPDGDSTLSSTTNTNKDTINKYFSRTDFNEATASEAVVNSKMVGETAVLSIGPLTSSGVLSPPISRSSRSLLNCEDSNAESLVSSNNTTSGSLDALLNGGCNSSSQTSMLVSSSLAELVLPGSDSNILHISSIDVAKMSTSSEQQLIINSSSHTPTNLTALATSSSLNQQHSAVPSYLSTGTSCRLLSSPHIDRQTLSLDSDIISASEIDSTPTLDILSSEDGNLTLGSEALSLPSHGVPFDHQDIMEGELVDHSVDSLKVDGLPSLRYLCATGAPGEFEMVAANDPRITHIVNEFGQLQEVVQSADGANELVQDTIECTPSTSDLMVSCDNITNQITGDSSHQRGGVPASSVQSIVVSSESLITSENSVDDLSFSGSCKAGDITEQSGVTISKPGEDGTIRVEEGNTVTVENFAALLGVLQSAGLNGVVPVELSTPQDEGQQSGAHHLLITTHEDLMNQGLTSSEEGLG